MKVKERPNWKIIRKDMVLIFTDVAFRKSDGKVSFGHIICFNETIVCARVGEEGIGSSKEAKTRAMPLSLNRAKVWGMRRG